jgi:hypothetical protein
MKQIIKEKESDEIRLLRHRYARTIEIWTAYNVFLLRQIKVGGDFICINDELAEQTTHTLLITYYSYLYSLFDPSGTNFITSTKPLIGKLSPRGVEVRKEIIEHWTTIKTPINKVRHNIGFHGGKELKNFKSGYAAFREPNLHPKSPDYILALLRVFFRDLSEIVLYYEDYGVPFEVEDVDEMYEEAKGIKEFIQQMSYEKFSVEVLRNNLLVGVDLDISR